METYPDIRHEIRPYDLFLFSGSGIISSVIQAASGSRWSHVGLALRLPEFPRHLLPLAARKMLDTRQDRVLILESTTLSGIDDLLTGQPIKGVQIVPFSERLATYDGAVAWRPVVGARTPAMHGRSAAFVRRYHGTPYEENRLELARAALDRFTLKENQPDTHSLFCSELVALHGRTTGILRPRDNESKGTRSWSENEFTPGDFSRLGLPFSPGFQAGDVVDMAPLDDHENRQTFPENPPKSTVSRGTTH